MGRGTAKVAVVPVERRDHSYEARSEVTARGRTIRANYPLVDREQVDEYVAHVTDEATRQGYAVEVRDTTGGRGR